MRNKILEFIAVIAVVMFGLWMVLSLAGCSTKEPALGEHHENVCYMDGTGTFVCDDGSGGTYVPQLTACSNCPPYFGYAQPGGASDSRQCAYYVSCCTYGTAVLIDTSTNPTYSNGDLVQCATVEFGQHCDQAVDCACGAGFAGIMESGTNWYIHQYNLYCAYDEN